RAASPPGAEAPGHPRVPRPLRGVRPTGAEMACWRSTTKEPNVAREPGAVRPAGVADQGDHPDLLLPAPGPADRAALLALRPADLRRGRPPGPGGTRAPRTRPRPPGRPR